MSAGKPEWVQDEDDDILMGVQLDSNSLIETDEVSDSELEQFAAEHPADPEVEGTEGLV